MGELETGGRGGAAGRPRAWSLPWAGARAGCAARSRARFAGALALGLAATGFASAGCGSGGEADDGAADGGVQTPDAGGPVGPEPGLSAPGLPRCEARADGGFSESAHPWQLWDNGERRLSMANLRGNTVMAQSRRFDLHDEPGWEAVRFELEHPACLHAVRVAWAKLPATAAPHTIGLYPDFGQNGFDFRASEPLWTGTLDLDASKAGEWATYVLDPPLAVAGPALVYAASFRNGASGPWLAIDDSTRAGDGTCANWDDCHSGLNYPRADEGLMFNGTSLPLPYDFVVRLQVEYPEVPAEADLWFHPNPAVSGGSNYAWGDYDDDGDDDLMVGGLKLYRNDRGGAFTEVTGGAGLTGLERAGGVWGDYDNDGCLDFYARGESSTGGESLLRNNCDGTFSERIAESGIDDVQTDVVCAGMGAVEHANTVGAAWGDLDGDGWLDLVQANFLCWATYKPYADRFWRNRGDGTFEEWGPERGFVRDALAGRGVTALDADLDGDIDVSIVNYVLQANLYYENLGGGTFAERAKMNGLSGKSTVFGGTTYFGHSIGAAWGDLDGDGDLDTVTANLAHPRFFHFADRTNVSLNEGGVWTNVADARGIEFRETHSNPSLLDFENDGDLDLAITEVYAGRPVDVYVNDGLAGFAMARHAAGLTTEHGWGSAVADYDGDGDADYLAGTLFRNDVPAKGHWLELRLVGEARANRAAIGAVAWVTAGGRTLVRFVSGGNGTGCQDAQTLHFGLGRATSVERVEVWFPGVPERVVFGPLEVDRAYRLSESGTVKPGLGR